MLVDAGKLADAPDYSAGNRLPRWLIPDGISAERAAKWRPDILFIPSLRNPALPISRAPADKSKHPIYLIEVGYTGDLRHAQKVKEKLQQHQDLADTLRQAGWTVHYSNREVVTLGHTGSIPKTLEPLLTKLGVPHETARRCCSDLHRHAVNCLGPIVKAYRQLTT